MPDPAVTATTVHRTRWFKRPWFLASAVIVLLGAVAFAVDPYAPVSGGDVLPDIPVRQE
jgi:hypothetical protein